MYKMCQIIVRHYNNVNQIKHNPTKDINKPYRRQKQFYYVGVKLLIFLLGRLQLFRLEQDLHALIVIRLKEE